MSRCFSEAERQRSRCRVPGRHHEPDSQRTRSLSLCLVPAPGAARGLASNSTSFCFAYSKRYADSRCTHDTYGAAAVAHCHRAVAIADPNASCDTYTYMVAAPIGHLDEQSASDTDKDVLPLALVYLHLQSSAQRNGKS
ncbi:hypothetical protein HRbin30_00951 [bacterium HR30]|nr:hypothetical protein HRbin30_00951 [bacterium HR30]